MSTQFGLKRALKAAGTLAVGALVCAGLLGSGLQAQAGAPSNILAGQERAGKIDASVTRDLAGDDSASIVILLKDQANLTAAYGMKDQDARGWYVYNTLRQHAERTRGMTREHELAYWREQTEKLRRHQSARERHQRKTG